jgi:AcrR family transcriptional regulator
VSTTRARLAAADRRAALLDAASRVFARGSYRGTTTSEIARECGISEPILYRHFDSKRDLYLACLSDVWARLRTTWEEALAEGWDPAEWAGHHREQKLLVWNLWSQALTEAGEDREIRRYLRRHLREVHDFVAGAVRSAQEGGHIPADRDPVAEAWIFIGVGLLVGQQVAGLTDEECERIKASRLRWLTGSA